MLVCRTRTDGKALPFKLKSLLSPAVACLRIGTLFLVELSYAPSHIRQRVYLFCSLHIRALSINSHYQHIMPSKFTEILDPEVYQTSSPQDDVRLEDIIAATHISYRARTSSEISSRSASSSSGDRPEEKTRKRLSRLLGKR